MKGKSKQCNELNRGTPAKPTYIKQKRHFNFICCKLLDKNHWNVNAWMFFISLKYLWFDIGKYLMYSVRFFSFTSNYRESRTHFLFAFDQFFLECLFLPLLVSRMRLFPLNFIGLLGDVVGFHRNLVRDTHYTFKFNHIYPTYRHAIQRNNLKNKHTNGDR